MKKHRWLGARSYSLGVLVAVLLVAASAVGDSRSDGDGEVIVTYVGNAGFLVDAGEEKVLIDALIDSAPGYVDQPAAMKEALAAAEGPYAGVDLVLATHAHADHFGPRAVVRHLAANPRARFVSTPQAVAKLRREAGFEAIADRVTAVLPAEGERWRDETPALEASLLEAVNLHHGRDRDPPVENLGLLFTVGGRRFLHVGDTECDVADFRAAGLAGENVDVALVPSWYWVRPWRGTLEETVAIGRRLAMHLAPGWADGARGEYPDDSRRRVAWLEENDPEVVVLRRPGEAWTVAGREPSPSNDL